jgi:glyoxylate/hydroxypyruvate reductase
MGILIAVKGMDSAAWEERMRRLAPQREIRVHPGNGETRGIRYALCWNPPQGLLASLPDLEVIFSLGAGVDHMLRDRELPDRSPCASSTPV